MKKLFLVFLFALLVPTISNSAAIDVLIKGIDDGIKSNKQQDSSQLPGCRHRSMGIAVSKKCNSL